MSGRLATIDPTQGVTYLITEPSMYQRYSHTSKKTRLPIPSFSSPPLAVSSTGYTKTDPARFKSHWTFTSFKEISAKCRHYPELCQLLPHVNIKKTLNRAKSQSTPPSPSRSTFSSVSKSDTSYSQSTSSGSWKRNSIGKSPAIRRRFSIIKFRTEYYCVEDDETSGGFIKSFFHR